VNIQNILSKEIVLKCFNEVKEFAEKWFSGKIERERVVWIVLNITCIANRGGKLRAAGSRKHLWVARKIC